MRRLRPLRQPRLKRPFSDNFRAIITLALLPLESWSRVIVRRGFRPDLPLVNPRWNYYTSVLHPIRREHRQPPRIFSRGHIGGAQRAPRQPRPTSTAASHATGAISIGTAFNQPPTVRRDASSLRRLQNTPNLPDRHCRKRIEAQRGLRPLDSGMTMSTQARKTATAKTIAKAEAKAVVKTHEVRLGGGAQFRPLLRSEAGDDAAHIAPHPVTCQPRREHALGTAWFLGEPPPAVASRHPGDCGAAVHMCHHALVFLAGELVFH